MTTASAAIAALQEKASAHEICTDDLAACPRVRLHALEHAEFAALVAALERLSTAAHLKWSDGSPCGCTKCTAPILLARIHDRAQEVPDGQS